MQAFDFKLPKIVLVVLLAATTLAAFARAASASSTFAAATIQRSDPAVGRDRRFGFCRLFIGPRDSIAAGEFLLRIGDDDIADGDEIELNGIAVPDGSGGFALSADDANAETFYESVLHRVLKLQKSDFDLRELVVEVEKTDLDLGHSDITCGLHLSGSILQNKPGFVSLSPRLLLPVLRANSGVDLSYHGAGTAYEPATVAAADQTASAPAAPAAACPTPNFTPAPDKCGTPGCLVTFAGYKWWTEYEFFPPPSYFYNMNNAWAPKNVTVDGEGLHLFVRVQDVGGGPQYTAGEAVTALNLDNSPAVLGYGTYLVTATVKSAASWAEMDPNVAFGAFTYERDPTGDSKNPARELDLAEISRWGRSGNTCRINPPLLCKGNSQFTVQLWDAQANNLNRYTIGAGVQTVTLVMQWPAAHMPVTYSQYEGTYTLDNLPASAKYTWTTSDDQNPTINQNKFIPASGCQQFHLNFWMGDFTDAVQCQGPNNPPGCGYNPPPASPQEVVVTNFQYKPL